MSLSDGRNAIEDACAAFHNLGDALRERQMSLTKAADQHRRRAVQFFDGAKAEADAKLLRFQRNHFEGARLCLVSNGTQPRSRRGRGQGFRFVSSATAAEVTVTSPVVVEEAKPLLLTDQSLKTQAAPPQSPIEVAPPNVKSKAPEPSSPATSAGGKILHPTLGQLLTHPVAAFHYVPKDASLFLAGAVAGATAKTLTAPLDRWKLMLQVKSVQNPNAVQAVGSVNLLESFVQIGKEEGLLGYWRGNLPQVLRIIPYSAVQLFAYETYKKLFMGKRDKLTVPARLAAGACAGMTSTFITYPLDVLRLRLAVEPGARQMIPVALRILRDEGAGAFYKGLGPSLISIAPYIALNFCAFDLVKKSIPEKYRKTPQASLFTALCATSFATVMCYPLDTVRRQMQMKTSPFNSILDAFPGIVKRDGVLGLYRGFIANALKNLPNSSIRLTTYDTAKNLIASSKAEFDRLVEERKEKETQLKPDSLTTTTTHSVNPSIQ